MQSDFIYSTRAKRSADEYGLTPDELAVVDLVSSGWDKREAFMLIYRVGTTWTDKALKDAVGEIFSKSGAKARRKEENKESSVSVEEPKKIRDALESISKENMLRDLVKARNRTSIGSKDWIDINKMIADITRMKNDEVKTEDTTVHFYLPLKCHQCKLYKNRK